MSTTSRRDYVDPGIYRRPGRANYILMLKLGGRQYTEALPLGVTLHAVRQLAAN